MRFSRTTAHQAEDFLRHVIAREPWRLGDLAHRMRATGGPLDQMDGSYASLMPLWRWFVQYADAGSPGVGDDELPSLWPTATKFDDDDASLRAELAPRRKTQVAVEGVAHYLRLVLERETGTARWRVYEQGPEGHDRLHHSTVVELQDERIINVLLEDTAAGLHNDVSAVRDDRTLLYFVPSGGGRVRERRSAGPSVLDAFAALDPQDQPVEARVSPTTSWSTDWWPDDAPARRRARESEPAVETRQRPAGEDMTLARGPAEGLEQPALLAPLHPIRTAAALTRAGFVGASGSEVTPSDLTDGNELAHTAGAAVIHVLAFRGSVRALHLEAVAADDATWESVTEPLQRLAYQSDARFVPDHQFAD